MRRRENIIRRRANDLSGCHTGNRLCSGEDVGQTDGLVGERKRFNVPNNVNTVIVHFARIHQGYCTAGFIFGDNIIVKIPGEDCRVIPFETTPRPIKPLLGRQRIISVCADQNVIT